MGAEGALALIFEGVVFALGGGFKVGLLKFDELGVVEGGYGLPFADVLAGHDVEAVYLAADGMGEGGSVAGRECDDSVEGGALGYVGGGGGGIEGVGLGCGVGGYCGGLGVGGVLVAGVGAGCEYEGCEEVLTGFHVVLGFIG